MANHESDKRSKISDDDPVLSNLQSVFYSILTEGLKHANNLKACEALVSKANSNLMKDPNNELLQKDNCEKLKKRADHLDQIKNFSTELAQKLFKSIQHKLSAVEKALSSSSSPSSSSLPSKTSRAIRDLEDQIDRVKRDSNKRSYMNEKESDRLESVISKQKDEIEDLRRTIKHNERRLKELENREKLNHTHRRRSNEPSHSNQDTDKTAHQRSNDNDCEDRPDRKLKVSEDALDRISRCESETALIQKHLAELANEHCELHSNVVMTFTKEIPTNLQRAVKLMQDDVNRSAIESITIGHEKLAELLKVFCDQYGQRIESLEEKALKGQEAIVILTTKINNHLKNQGNNAKGNELLNVRKRSLGAERSSKSPNQTPNVLLPNPDINNVTNNNNNRISDGNSGSSVKVLNMKDPRILRHQSLQLQLSPATTTTMTNVTSNNNNSNGNSNNNNSSNSGSNMNDNGNGNGNSTSNSINNSNSNTNGPSKSNENQNCETEENGNEDFEEGDPRIDTIKKVKVEPLIKCQNQ